MKTPDDEDQGQAVDEAAERVRANQPDVNEVDDTGDHPDRRLRVVSGPHTEALSVAALLDSATIQIRLPDDSVPWRQQVLAIALVDLLGRLFPRIDLVCKDQIEASSLLPPGPELLLDRLRDAARHGGLTPMAPAEPAVVINVGRAEPTPAGSNSIDGRDPAASTDDAATPSPSLHVDGRGWTSYNGTVPTDLPNDDDQSSPIGSLTAACRAAAQTTQVILGALPAERISPALYASSLTYTVDTTPTEPILRTPKATPVDALLVGAGSVGGAAAYTFARVLDLSGALIVADPEQLEPKNLDRALLATQETTASRAGKVNVVVDALQHHNNLTVEPWPGTIQKWVAAQPRTAPLPTVLAAVDSLEARRAIQDCLPLNVINAACHPSEIQISGHRTNDGPCVCCLHMQDALDSSQTRKRILQRETGLVLRMIEVYLTQNTPLDERIIQGIEAHRRLPEGSLAQYEGHTLEQLRAGHLLYGATPLDKDNAIVAVAAPYVTALAGILLAAETLKAGSDELAVTRLGPFGLSTKYAENPIAGPEFAQLTDPPRWPGTECLCRSARRARILNERYGLA